jgi:hypothetical protein
MESILTEKEVVTLLEANEVVQPLEFGTVPSRTADLCSGNHNGDLLCAPTSDMCERCVSMFVYR